MERQALTPIEEAVALRSVMNRTGETQRELAQRFLISQPQISKRLALLELPIASQQEIEHEVLTEEQALEIHRGAKAPPNAPTESARSAVIHRPNHRSSARHRLAVSEWA